MGEETKEQSSTQLSGDWRDNLPANVQEWDECKNSDSADKFFDQVANMRSLVGNSIRVPSEEASDDARNEFYEKIKRKAPDLMRTPNVDDDVVMSDVWGSLGKPDTPAKYDLPEFGDWEVPEDRAQELKEIAHKSNLTKKQFKAMATEMFGAEHQNSLAAKELNSSDRKELTNEWGEAMDQRTALALQVAQKSGAPEGLIKAVESGNADKATMQWLYAMSKQMTVEGQNMVNLENSVDSPSDLQGKIDDMLNNTAHPYWDESHPQHASAVDKMMDMRKRLAA